MSLLISRIVITLLLTYLIFLAWTKNVDLISWGKNKVEGLLPIAPTENVNVSFAVSAEYGLDPIEERKYTDEEPKLWSKVRLRYRLSTLSTTTQWSRNTIIGIVFFSGDRLHKTESGIPKWVSDTIKLGEKPVHHRLLHHSVNIGEVNSAKPSITNWMEAYISTNHTPWKAAVYVLPENSKAEWFQLTIKKGDPKLEPKSGSGVQVRGYNLEQTKNPVVSAEHEKLL